MRRRKEVLCVLCEREMTYEASGVCRGCRGVYEAGKRFRGKFGGEEAELVSVKLNRQLDPPSRAFGRKEDQRRESYTWPDRPIDSLMRAAMQMAGGSINWASYAPNVYAKDAPAAISVENLPHESATGDPKAIVAPPNKIEPIRAFFQALVDVLQENYEEGFNAGNSMIVRLANGDLSINQLEDRSTRKQ